MIEIAYEGVDTASCMVDGTAYRASSRTGAVHALCRKLRAAGVPDQPWRVPGRISGGSIHWMADRMVVDTDTGVRTTRWKPHPAASGGLQDRA